MYHSCKILTRIVRQMCVCVCMIQRLTLRDTAEWWVSPPCSSAKHIICVGPTPCRAHWDVCFLKSLTFRHFLSAALSAMCDFKILKKKLKKKRGTRLLPLNVKLQTLRVKLLHIKEMNWNSLETCSVKRQIKISFFVIQKKNSLDSWSDLKQEIALNTSIFFNYISIKYF